MLNNSAEFFSVPTKRLYKVLILHLQVYEKTIIMNFEINV